MDQRVTLGVLLDHLMVQLQVDAAAILLVDSVMNTLVFAAGAGFRTDALRYTRLRIGEGHAGRAALERARVCVQDLRANPGEFARSAALRDEGFASYCGVPLESKGRILGVIEVLHRSPFPFDADWLGFLDALAGQAAIAVDSATLFDRLQKSNTDLLISYEATLEGWVRALDLRDRETEGHTQRVTDLTVRLARAHGLDDVAIRQVRRGALLHDIGKMGVPDAILHKAGPLTDEEWVVMRRHTELARDFLDPIPYLRPAMDIPYGHHEKWDGTGYPRGLSGDEISLAARLFAVVDVWDALLSERPYKPAWPWERAVALVRSEAGKHVDPAVVETFLTLLETEP